MSDGTSLKQFLATLTTELIAKKQVICDRRRMKSHMNLHLTFQQPILAPFTLSNQRNVNHPFLSIYLIFYLLSQCQIAFYSFCWNFYFSLCSTYYLPESGLIVMYCIIIRRLLTLNAFFSSIVSMNFLLLGMVGLLMQVVLVDQIAMALLGFTFSLIYEKDLLLYQI